MDRVAKIDAGEVQQVEEYFEYLVNRWRSSPPPRYGGFGPPDEEVPLMYPSGTEPLPLWNASSGGPPWATPSSMRNVDAGCELGVIYQYPDSQEGAD